MNRVQTKLAKWGKRSKLALGEYFNICKPYFSENSQTENELHWVVTQLAISCHLTSESSLILIGHNRLWEAEILIRSTLEGTLKLIYICMGDEDEQEIRKNEYWDDLPRIKALKRHQHLSAFLSQVDNPSSDIWEPLKRLLLEQEDIDEVNSAYPFKLRQQLQQKWSFGEIVKTLSTSDTVKFDSLMGLYFVYGMGSHLIHQDADAVGLIWERNQREQWRREALELAHGAREISDLLTLAMIQTLMVFKLHQADPAPIAEVFQSHQEFRNELQKVHTQWWQIESQD